MKTTGFALVVCLIVALFAGCASLETSEDNIGDYDMGGSRFDMDAE